MGNGKRERSSREIRWSHITHALLCEKEGSSIKVGPVSFRFRIGESSGTWSSSEGTTELDKF